MLWRKKKKVEAEVEEAPLLTDVNVAAQMLQTEVFEFTRLFVEDEEEEEAGSHLGGDPSGGASTSVGAAGSNNDGCEEIEGSSSSSPE